MKDTTYLESTTYETNPCTTCPNVQYYIIEAKISAQFNRAQNSSILLFHLPLQFSISSFLRIVSETINTHQCNTKLVVFRSVLGPHLFDRRSLVGEGLHAVRRHWPSVTALRELVSDGVAVSVDASIPGLLIRFKTPRDVRIRYRQSSSVKA